MAKGFTSDILRAIYKAAVKQGWERQPYSRSGHYHLKCPLPECHYREAFSSTGKGFKGELMSKLRDMRSHGFLWQGRGGQHTAEPLRRRENETSNSG